MVPLDVPEPIRTNQVIELIMLDAPLLGAASWFVGMSVVPCENENAKNRKAATAKEQAVSFSRVAGCAVNRQALEVGLGSTQAEITCGKPLADADVSSGSVAIVATCDDRMDNQFDTYRRGVPAQHLHRTDWIAEQLALDPHFQWATPAAWAKWREAWLALPPQRQATYMVHSESVRVHAQRNVAEGRRADDRPAVGSLALAPGGAADHAVMPVEAVPTLPHIGAVKMNFFTASAPALLALDGPGPGNTCDVAAPLLSERPPASPLPMGPAIYECLVLRGGKHGVAGYGPLAVFRDRFSKAPDLGMSRVAGAFMRQSQLPKKTLKIGAVTYPEKPVALDPTAPLTTARQRKQQQLLKECFERRMKLSPNGSAKNVADADLFFAIHVQSDDFFQEPVPTLFVQAIDAVGATPTTCADQIFFMYRLLYEAADDEESSDIIGAVIEVMRDDFKEPYVDATPGPFSKYTMGPCKDISAEELTASVCTQGDTIMVDQLSVEQVWADGAFDQYRIIGILHSLPIDVDNSEITVPVVVADPEEFDIMTMICDANDDGADASSSAAKPSAKERILLLYGWKKCCHRTVNRTRILFAMCVLLTVLTNFLPGHRRRVSRETKVTKVLTTAGEDWTMMTT